MAEPSRIPFNDLTRIHRPLERDLTAAFGAVMASGMYLRGSQTQAFEEEWADYCGQRHAVTCNSGTDALALAAAALELESATVPASTLPLTALGVHQGGAGVRVGDVGADGRLEQTVPDAVPVLLFGRLPTAAEARAALFDAAHAHGWQPPQGAVATWSFYPTKTLGALGDAGAVTTDDDALAERMRRLRGMDDRWRDPRQRTSRMDELQAAFLRVKLRHLDEWLADRARVGRRYDEALAPYGITLPGASLYHLYVVKVPDRDRDRVRAHLAERGIATKVHWERPLHELDGPWDVSGTFPGADRWNREVLSLPCFPGLADAEIDRVVAAVAECLGADR